MSAKAKRNFKEFFDPIDLTKGRVWKVILKFSVPIIFSYLLQQLYTLVDAAICGQNLSANQVAGVNDTASLSFIFLQFATGLTAGFGVILSNKIGEKNGEGARRSFATQIILGAVLSVLLTAVALLLINPLLALIGVAPSKDQTAQEVYKSAYRYIFIIFSGISAQVFYNLICSVLRSLGDSFTPLLFLFLSAILNVGLDLLFIKVFKMGVEGAAFATVIAQGASAISSFVFTFVKYKEMRLKKEDFKFSFRFALDHLKQGVPLGFQFSILAFGLIAMQRGVIAFDYLPSGAMVENLPAQNGYSSANRIIGLMMMPFNALGTAMLAFIGQNDGAKDEKRIKQGFNQGMILILIMTLIVTAFGCLISIKGAYQYVFLSADKITAESIKFGHITLFADIPFYFLLGALIFYRSGIQGLGKSVFPLLAGVGELVARVLICVFLPTLINGAPIDAFASKTAYYFLCFADPGAWIVADIILVYAVLRHVYFPKKKG